jgi:hypothetical protein
MPSLTTIFLALYLIKKKQKGSMKLSSLFYIPAFTILFACSNQGKTGNSTTEAPAQESAVSSPAKAPTAAASSPVANKPTTNAGPVILTGRDFQSPDFNPPHIESGGMQLLQHFGSLSATANLKKDCSRIRIHLKPRPENNSYPVVGLLFERTGGGKYLRAEVLKNEVLKAESEIEKSVNLPKGEYRVTFQFFKCSATDRAQLEIHTITLE